jgi:hypothetical protein
MICSMLADCGYNFKSASVNAPNKALVTWAAYLVSTLI